MTSRCALAVLLLSACAADSDPAPRETTAALETATGTWRPMTVPAWVGLRYRHTAVWTGQTMIVYGGFTDVPQANLAVGAEYDPARDTWTALPPGPFGWRMNHFAAWTGNRMIVWGGWRTGETGELLRSPDGALYDPATRTWTSIRPSPVSWRRGSAVAWSTTTNEILAIGGNSGGSDLFENVLLRYTLANDTWTWNTRSPLIARAEHGGVWTGHEFVIFGGRVMELTEAGWTPTGSRRGAAYEPVSKTWNTYRDEGNTGSLDISFAPTRRAFNRRTGDLGGATFSAAGDAAAGWYGGKDWSSDWRYTDQGAIFLPGDPPTWLYLPVLDGEARARIGAAAWATAKSFYVWGGQRPDSTVVLDSGLEVDLATGTTRALPAPPSTLPGRKEASAIWTGKDAILYGGHCESVDVDCHMPSGAIYTPGP